MVKTIYCGKKNQSIFVKLLEQPREQNISPLVKKVCQTTLLRNGDLILSYISETKNSSIVKGKMIFLQGSPILSKTGGVLTGRLSGIVKPSYTFIFN